MPAKDRSSSERLCPNCEATVLPEAAFCHRCGRRFGDQPVRARWNWATLALVVVGGIAILGVGSNILVKRYSNGTEPILRQFPVDPPPMAPAPSAQSVDLSSMTPREAADRLFNRVMAAEENGNHAEAGRFAPMAMQAYGRVGVLDADARYHVGLIGMVLGDFAETDRQVGALRKEAPDHLLASVLAYRLAEQSGDVEAMAAARAQFTAAFNKEMGRGRPEYEAHRVTIEKFRPKAQSSNVATTAAMNRPVPDDGAQLFAAKCSGCHGNNAVGSDKGPPLVHQIYEPGHHADESFFQAVRQGVKSHHWQFGDMPAVPGVTDDQVKQIVAHVRALQVRQGIK